MDTTCELISKIIDFQEHETKQKHEHICCWAARLVILVYFLPQLVQVVLLSAIQQIAKLVVPCDVLQNASERIHVDTQMHSVHVVRNVIEYRHARQCE